MQPQSSTFSRQLNVLPEYKDLEVEEIKARRQAKAFPAAVAMMQIQGDFNFSSVVRNANAFGFEKVFYVGPKKGWDRRGAVGTHHYIDVIHCKTIGDLIDATIDLRWVALENNLPGEIQSIYDYQWNDKSLFLIGEEGIGLSAGVLRFCDDFVTIPQYGTVPSVNAATAAGIAMNAYCAQQSRKENV